jgi:hypothetical protein
VVPWAQAPELRLDHDNGVTLCADCHSAEHSGMSSALFAQGRV